MDTCSIAFRVTGQDWSDLLLSKPHKRVAGGGVVFVEPGPGKTKLGAHGRGLIWWEGRLDALLTDSESGWNLRPARDLPMATEVVATAFGCLAREPIDYGLHELRPEVRRFDLAHEFEFENPRDGLAFMRTVAGMCPSRRKLDVITAQDGQPETVYVRQSKSFVVTERLYDKGVESKTHAPGHRLRYEAQRRFPKSKRHHPAVLPKLDLGAEYGRSIHTYMEGSHDVIAAGPDATVAHLAGAAARGDMSIAKAERMIGTVALLREYGRAVYPDVQQQQRRLRGLREAGVSLDDQLPADHVVPVGRLLRESVEAFRV